MKLNTENIKRGPLTTITGLILILSGIASVFIQSVGATWSEALIVISAGIALLFLNDKNDPQAPTTNVEIKGNATINTPSKEDPGSVTGHSLAFVWVAVFLTSALLFFSSCSTIRVPNSEDRASRVVAKNIRQNEAIFTAFPDIREIRNVGVTLPEVVFETDTVYKTVVDPSHLERIAALEELIANSGNPEAITRWREYIDNKPPDYTDGVYKFESELFLSEVSLKGGQISNRVTIKERDVQSPQAIIREVKKTSLFDWSLRIIFIAALIFVVLLFVRRRGI